jgi:hypothetical protein
MNATGKIQAATRAHDMADFGRWFESSPGAIANNNRKATPFQPGQSGSSLA